MGNNSMKEKLFSIFGCVFFIVCFIAVFVAFAFGYVKVEQTYKENRELKKKIDFYEECEIVRYGVIIDISNLERGGVIYVVDEYNSTDTDVKIIEVDVFDDEVIYTTIEVGYIAVYTIDYDYTDADLIAVLKQ